MKNIEIPVFTGFSPATKKFFNELKKNNNKEWFDANRQKYEEKVRTPSKLLASEMSRQFAKLGLPYFADPKRSLFRINRDIRFSPNKEPYKTNMGAFFPYGLSQSSKKPVEAPGLYFHFDYQDSFIACGIHSPEPNALKALRERISEEWQPLEKITSNKKFKKEFPEHYPGEALKTIPKGYPKDHPAGEWLRLKEITYWCQLNFDDTYSEKLISMLTNKAVAALELHEFIVGAIE